MMNFYLLAFLSTISIQVGKANAAEHTTLRTRRHLMLKASKSQKTAPLEFDPPEWNIPDVALLDINESYLGEFENFVTSDAVVEFDGEYTTTGAPFVIDLGSFGGLTRRLGSTIVLSEIRSIWVELAPIVAEHDGIIMKSLGDSLFLYFDKVSDGVIATRAMYNAVVARWQDKVSLACDGDSPQDWCEARDEESERDRFFNTMSSGGGYGETILIVPDGRLVDAVGAPVNNAFFAGEETAEHGETMIDESALQSLLVEAGQATDNFCQEGGPAVPWTQGDFGIDRFILREFFGFSFCYYTLCFDAECQIPDDE